MNKYILPNGAPSPELLTRGADKKTASLLADAVGIATTIAMVAVSDKLVHKPLLRWSLITATAIGSVISTNLWKKHISEENPDASFAARVEQEQAAKDAASPAPAGRSL